MICRIITKCVHQKPKDWDSHLSAALWAYRTSFKTSLGFTPFHLVFGQEALLPIEVELASLRVLATGIETTQCEKAKSRILDLQRLELDREKAVEHYAREAEKRRLQFNDKVTNKGIGKGALVLRYDNRFDYRHDGKFLAKWQGPYLVTEKFENGSYQLQDITGKVHHTRVNGWRLKPYFCRIKPQSTHNLGSPLEHQSQGFD